MTEINSRSVSQLLNLIRSREAAVEQVTPCSLECYQQLVATLSRPTAAQIADFVDYVSGAHSWYKHIPPLPPGLPFCFFLDPSAGLDRAVYPDKTVQHRERTPDSPGLHYNWMTTSDYRSRFGFLSYKADAGTRMYFALGDDIHDTADRAIISTPAEVHRIPPEIAMAGTALLTGLIHTESESAWVWTWWNTFPEIMGQRQWPSETGGVMTLAAIRTLLQSRRHIESWQQAYDSLECFQKEMKRLVEPERNRQRDIMASAIERMLEVALDDPPSRE